MSDSTVMIRILKESLGIEKKKRSTVYNDLDHLAGTWSAQESDDFLHATSVFEKVDDDLWK